MKKQPKHRIHNALKIIDIYEGVAARRVSMIDAITDLMHFADVSRIDFGEVLNMAKDHHEAERQAP